MQASALRLLVKWQSSVYVEAVSLIHAAVCCTTVCVTDYAACKTTLPDVSKLMTTFPIQPSLLLPGSAVGKAAA